MTEIEVIEHDISHSIHEKMNWFLPKLIVSCFIFFIFYLVATYYYQTRIKNRPTSPDNLLHYEFTSVIYYLILFTGFIAALLNMNIKSTTLLTLFGSIGLAVALSLQSVLTNVAAGFYISFNGLYSIGDIIQISGPGNVLYKGRVNAFSLFNTTIENSSNNYMTVIPNTYIQNNIMTRIDS